LLDGQSPFPGPGDPSIEGEYAYVYPPLLAYLLAPFAALATTPAVLVAVGLLVLALFGTLRVLGVRDWRCYTVLCLWAPVFDGLWTASVSIALSFVLALAWRWRLRRFAGGGTLALAIAVKLLLAPLLVWPAALGRWRSVAVGSLGAAALVLGPWAATGFADLARYPDLVRELARLEQSHGYSLVAALSAVGVDVDVARTVALLLGCGLLAGAFVLGRGGDDVGSLTLGLFGSVSLSPIGWQHYWVLFVVPLSLVRPRFSVLWLLPALSYVGIFKRIDDDARALSVAVMVLVCAAVFVIHRNDRRRSSSTPRARRRVRKRSGTEPQAKPL
jgi:hypothetical protein